jgi:hypothetical protein
MSTTVIDKHAYGPIVGTYRVRFRLANEGIYRHLETSIIVYAVSREHAVASVPGGLDSEVLVWGPRDERKYPLSKQAPRFEHDCEECVWLGQYEAHDLYWCAEEGERGCAIARRSDDGPDYSSSSMPETAVRCTPLYEAWERVRVLTAHSK